jgi:hypothetical protein
VSGFERQKKQPPRVRRTAKSPRRQVAVIETGGIRADRRCVGITLQSMATLFIAVVPAG